MRTVRHTDQRGLEWEIEERYENALRAEILPRLDGLARAPGVDTVKRNRVRTVLRLRLEGAPDGPEEVYLKRYHARGLAATLKSLVRPSRARREWEMARAFEEAGIPTAHAIARAEKRRHGVEVDAAYVCRGLMGARDFVPWILTRAPDPTNTADLLRRRRLLHRLARLARRQHDLGLDHPDLHSGNILLVPDDDEREVSLAVIDLHSASKRGGPLAPARRLRLLAKLLHSLREVSDTSDRYRFLRDYAAGGGNLLGRLPRAYRAVEARVRALERRRLKSRSKRCMKRSSRFTLSRAEGWNIRHLRSHPSAVLVAAARAHDEALAMDERVVKRGRKGAVTRVRIRTMTGEETVIVKESRPRWWRAWLGARLGRSRGRRGWKLGNALAVRGIAVARPLAYLLRARGLLVRRELLVMEDVSRGGERLDHLVLRLHREGTLDVETRRALTSEVSRFVRKMHRAGVYHGDLKACNLFVQTREGKREIRIVDYDRAIVDRPVRFRRRIKNLAQLSASIPRCISRSDRLRFFRAFAPSRNVAGRWKQHARAVDLACRSKIVVDMEPIE